jgi:two-component system, OmpR family, phosphate regulon sensor histidine kinase PhoR
VNEILLLVACIALVGALVYLRGQLKFQENELQRLEAATQSELNSQVTNLERERRRSGEILERMDEGVLVLTGDLTPIRANTAARELLRLGTGPLPGRLPSDEVLTVARRALTENEPCEDTISLWPALRSLRLRALPLEDQGGVAIVFQDVTEELRTLRVRRQFVANASHELKSPVASLQALADAIREAVQDDPATARRFAEKLVGESERLGRLIADLLDLSRLEDPNSTSTRATDLSRVARTQTRALLPEATAKNLRVIEHIEPGVWIKGDDQQLGLMIRNLLDNALRYTPEGGSIEVELEREGADAVVRVRDTGIGIPLNAQSRVFERFYRVDMDRSRDGGGTGLGLSIVRHVAELHAGHVGVESELGEGSTFIVRLPATSRGETLHPVAS